MEDKKYFDIEDELMLDYAEMTSFNFESPDYLALASEKEIPAEYARQKYTFKYGNYDVLDMIQSMICRVSPSRR